MPASPNPQGGSASSSSSSSGPKKLHGHPRSSSSTTKTNHKALPPLLWYMEHGDWVKATERAKRHPREVRTWATLRTKSMAPGNSTSTVSGTKRLALHHACFKLRSLQSSTSTSTSTSTSMDNRDEFATTTTTQDPFVDVCRFILLLLRLFPEAAGMRESRHGCLPLHLAAFASCAPRQAASSESTSSTSVPLMTMDLLSMGRNQAPLRSMDDSLTSTTTTTRKNSGVLTRPCALSNQQRSVSDATHDTTMTNMLAQERYTGTQTMEHAASPKRRQHQPTSRATHPNNNDKSRTSHACIPAVRVSQKPNIFISSRREDMAVQVLNALLDAYPKGIRVDSEGGRLPLHTACAGRATPRVISTLLTAYPAAARHRNKDGFLPLHLSAHWGVSQPNVAIALLKCYPDATLGRNRWERTPLEEALCMAGENGRPHQAALVRALRKHPSYWTRPPEDLFSSGQPQAGRRVPTIVDMDETIGSEGTSTHEEDGQYYNAVGDVDGLERQKNRFTPPKLLRKGHKNEGLKPSVPCQDLAALIKAQNWDSVIDRLEVEPNEASEHLKLTTRGGFVASSGLTPLAYACERRPPVEVIEALLEASPEAATTTLQPGGTLPLHIACTWNAPPAVVSLLLATEPAACRVPDALGNLALHAACFSGAVATIVDGLVRTYPKSVLARNNQGSLASDIVKRLRHDNRRPVAALLYATMDQLMAPKQMNHQRSHSSSSASSLAMRAAELNARDEYLETRGTDSSKEGDMGVEIVPLDDCDGQMVWI